ncbi:PAS domain S-box protein [Candidatus Chloroploca sp. M-50]|uniref:histidine kinase n=1 Tax=Candidatus Chloroploca mongolica TaxID=2528176 RepID=A0ABS4DE07_9CHLR|nr:CHASE4 domain-containing protein [Candidatus Chloroploca mongolica]MBP1467667.1 PAS domain S-box protein [Candidatus Chloroploca mongolica]
MNLVSLRLRILLATFLLFGMLLGALLWLVGLIIGQGFAEVEERTVAMRVDQVTNALNNDLADLTRLTRDYAVWDDSFAFVREPNPTFIENNFVDATFLNNKIGYVAFVNIDGEIVYEHAFDLELGEQVDPPAALRRFDGPNAPLLQHDEFAEGLAGLLILDERLWLLAAHPILTSLGEGPPAGTLLMARDLNRLELARLAELTRLPFTLTHFDDPAIHNEFAPLMAGLAAGEAVAIYPRDAQTIIGATQFDDLYGGSGVLLTVELPREVYQLGQQASRQYMVMLVGVGMLFGLLIFALLERTVLRRMIALRDQVGAVQPDQPEARVAVKGRDEIAQLATSINAMLERLRQAQQRISESAQRYRQLTELSPDAIIVHDGQTVRYANPAASQLLGQRSPQPIVGQPVDPVLGELVPQPDGTPVLRDRMLLRSDGSVIETEVVVLPFRDGDTVATQAIVRNITQRKQIEHALRDARDAADAANRAKSQFLATMSHELRTPLTAIIGYAELLIRSFKDTAPAEVMHDLGRIKSAGKQLQALIDDVLDLSKIEAGRMQVEIKPLNVSELIEAVLDTAGPLAKQNQNALGMVLHPRAGAMITDEMRLRQILLNLLSNACKFTHQGTVTLEVTVLAGEAGSASERISFAVHDTGIGISPTQMPMLFQDFMQADASTTRKYGGTGLGLALSQRLAYLLGGEVTVKSQPGVGSTFTLTLPRVLDPEVAQMLRTRVLQAITPLGSAPSSALEVSTETQLVLCVSEDAALVEQIASLLAHVGLHVEMASSPAQGEELARILLPDLILLDMRLAMFARAALLHQLHQDASTNPIPVAMLFLDATHHESSLDPHVHSSGPHDPASALAPQGASLRPLVTRDTTDLVKFLRQILAPTGWIVDVPTFDELQTSSYPGLGPIEGA